MTEQEIRDGAPCEATGYYRYDGLIRYIRKTPKNYFYQTTKGGRWREVPITVLRFVIDNYEPL